MTLIDEMIPVKGKFVKETRGYREADVQVAIRNVLKEIKNINPLECIRDEKNPDNCSCIACVRDTMRNDIKRILKQNFGDALVATGEGAKNEN